MRQDQYNQCMSYILASPDSAFLAQAQAPISLFMSLSPPYPLSTLPSTAPSESLPFSASPPSRPSRPYPTSLPALPPLVVVCPPIPPSEIPCPYRMFSAVWAPRSACCAASDEGSESTGVWVEGSPSWPEDLECGFVTVFWERYLWFLLAVVARRRRSGEVEQARDC